MRLLGAIVAALIPVIVNLMPGSGNVNLIGLHVSQYSYGLSTIAVLDLQLENSGEKAVRLTEVKLKIEKIFRFDAPLPPLARIPATGSYHVSLAELNEGDEANLGLFHEISANSADRIVLTLGGNGLSINNDGSVQRADPSYLARIRVILLSGKQSMAESDPIYVLVLNLDNGTRVAHDKNNGLKNLVENGSLPRMTTSDIRRAMHQRGLWVPEWFE